MALKRTVLEVEVLWNTEDYPLIGPSGMGLREIAYEGIEGGFSIGTSVISEVEVTPDQMAELLKKQGSDPEFLLGDGS